MRVEVLRLRNFSSTLPPTSTELRRPSTIRRAKLVVSCYDVRNINILLATVLNSC